jgi:hypothetical protein
MLNVLRFDPWSTDASDRIWFVKRWDLSWFRNGSPLDQ